jgi:NADH:ubiquinone oxidoreductase subunit 6 (subunit J)
MVTAGVYLLVRCSPLIEQSEVALTIILVVGAVTAFFAASVGLFQNDIKKVIAFSTMSQLAPNFKNVNQTICEKIIISKYITFNSQIMKTYKNKAISKLISNTEAICLILVNNKTFLLILIRTFYHRIFNSVP